MNSLLPVIVPVGFIIVIGFIVGRTLSLQRKTLSQLTLYVLSPALIIDSLHRTTLSVQSTTGILLSFALTSSLIYLIVWGIGKVTKLLPSMQKALLATALFPNNGNIGLAVVIFSLGDTGLQRAVVCLIGSVILMFCFGPPLLQGKGITYGIKTTIKLPLSWAIITGLILRFSSFQLPLKLDLGVEKLGQAAIPTALILLGIQLTKTKFDLGIKEMCAAGMRLLLAPLIAYIIGYLLHLDSLSLKVLVLQSAMPTAVNAIVLVTEFGGDVAFVTRTIIASTLMSFVTLPIVLWLLST